MLPPDEGLQVAAAGRLTSLTAAVRFSEFAANPGGIFCTFFGAMREAQGLESGGTPTAVDADLNEVGTIVGSELSVDCLVEATLEPQRLG